MVARFFVGLLSCGTCFVTLIVFSVRLGKMMHFANFVALRVF